MILVHEFLEFFQLSLVVSVKITIRMKPWADWLLKSKIDCSTIGCFSTSKKIILVPLLRFFLNLLSLLRFVGDTRLGETRGRLTLVDVHFSLAIEDGHFILLFFAKLLVPHLLLCLASFKVMFV